MRARLFLEAFGVRAALLNAELPLNSRHHILQVRGPFKFGWQSYTGAGACCWRLQAATHLHCLNFRAGVQQAHAQRLIATHNTLLLRSHRYPQPKRAFPVPRRSSTRACLTTS